MTDTMSSRVRGGVASLTGVRRWLAMILLLAIGLVGIGVGQSLMIDHGVTFLSAGIYALGAAALVILAWPALSLLQGAIPGHMPQSLDLPAPAWLVGAGLASSLIALGRSWNRAGDASTTDIVAFWLTGIVLLLLAATWGSMRDNLPRIDTDAMRHWPWPTIGAALSIVCVAALARLVMLGRFTTVLDSDEGFFLLTARQAREGNLPNPFQTSFFAVPDLYVAVEGWLSRPFSDQFASYRIVSAIAGIAAVYATWRLGRRLLGPAIGLAGAAILAFMPLHLWASRSALNNAFDACVLAIALLCADRAIGSRSRTAALTSGLVMGFGLFGYYGSRVFPAIILAWMVVAIFLPETRLPFAQLPRIVGWMLIGVLAAGAPILGYYGANPDIFMSRMRLVSLSEPDAHVGLIDRLTKVPNGLLYPFLEQASGFHGGFYRQGPPFLGWSLAPLVAIGGITWIVWFLHGLRYPQPGRARPAGLLLTWLVICAGISQTEDMQSQRFLAVSFVWALAAGTGIVVLAMALRSLVRIPIRGLHLLTAIALVGIAVWNAHLYFSEDQQIVAYGDRRTTAAYDIAWRIQQLPASPDFMLVGAEYLSYNGFGNWQFMNPGLGDHITIMDPFHQLPASVPELTNGQMLILAGERPASQRCAIQMRNPNARAGEARNRYGTLLYTVFSAGPDLVLPQDESPGETTLTPIESSLCQEQAS